MINKKAIYAISFIFGFISCWFLFKSSFFFNFYKNIFIHLTYKGIIFIAFFIMSSVFWFILNNSLKNFFKTKKQLIITMLCSLTTIYAIYFISCIVLDKYVVNWKNFTIHTLNFLLYIFAWYSLIKAFKVWRKYGNFYQLLLSGSIKKYLIIIISILFFINILIFIKEKNNLTTASGLLFLSTFILSILCYISTIIFTKSKFLISKIKIWQEETITRINNQEKPKEVSIAYDQMTLICLLSIIAKRVFDINKATDFQFIISKVFKIVCYSVSLIVTCQFTMQIKKMSKTILTIFFILAILLAFAYTPNFHYFLIANPKIDKVICNIIDYVFLPFGTIKVIIQIITLLIAKKTTGISINYFIIGAFFSTITSLNLISKENFYDNTITMSLYKCMLYLTMAFIAIIIEKINNKKYKKL